MKSKAAKFSPSFHLQVGECQKEGSGSGKQGSRGRGDLWVLSQGGQRRLRTDGREGAEAEERERECREGRGIKNNKIYETKREERKAPDSFWKPFWTSGFPTKTLFPVFLTKHAKHWCMYHIALHIRQGKSQQKMFGHGRPLIGRPSCLS